MPALFSEPSFWILAAIVFFSYTIQMLSGFGSTIIAVTLGLHLYPIDFLLPILVPLDLFINGYLVVRHRQFMDRGVLLKDILPIMGTGLISGVLVFEFVQGQALKIAFGILVMALSIRALATGHKAQNRKISLFTSKFFILGAGIVHGIYASGGPLLVYALSRLNLSKAVFRSTLAGVWTVMNIVLLAAYLISAKVNAATVVPMALLFPVILAGMALGEKLHRRVDEHQFAMLVYLLLLGAGFALII